MLFYYIIIVLVYYIRVLVYYIMCYIMMLRYLCVRVLY